MISCFCIAVQIPVLLLFLNYFLSFSRQRFTGAGVSEWTPAGVLTNFENRWEWSRSGSFSGRAGAGAEPESFVEYEVSLLIIDYHYCMLFFLQSMF